MFKLKIVKQDSNFVSSIFDAVYGGSGLNYLILDETNEDNILSIRASIDSNGNRAASNFSKCKKI